MPVSIIPISQQFRNQFKNDLDFTANPSDYTNNFSGSVMEKVQFSLIADVEWYSQATEGKKLRVVSQTRINYDGNYLLDGFSGGDTVVIERRDAAGVILSTHTGTIGSVTANVMIFDAPVAPAMLLEALSHSFIRGTTPLTASVFKFGLNGDGENFNVESKVSDNDQAYYGSNIGFDTGGGVRDTNFVNLQQLGQYQDWKTGSMQIRYIQNPSTYVQQFEIVHEFIIVPYYLDGELTNLQNNIIPTLLDGLNSLKYVYSAGFRTVLSNPNTEKTVQIDDSLGSVAWFNENFNGFNNGFNIDSVTYTDNASGASADGVLIAGITDIEIVVSKDSGSFVSGDRYGAYVSYLPEQSEYQDTILTDLVDNFIYDSVVFNSNTLPAATGQDFITRSTADVSGGLMTISIRVEYSLAQKTFLNNKLSSNPPNFIIGIELGDVTLPSGNSDRVILLADVAPFDESPDIEGLMDLTKFNIYPHDRLIGVGAASTDSTLWNEDGLAVDFDFDLDLNKDAQLISLDFKLVAVNSVTGNLFELDSYTYPIAGAIVSSGVQQLNVTTTRGYILEVADQFNDVTLSVGANAAGIQTYSGVFAQKVSWQEWIANNGVDTIFYDTSEPNDNFNDKASNYSLLNNYEIKLAVVANLYGTNDFGVSGFTDYNFLSPALTVYDYTLDGNITPVWSGVIETFNPSNMANLGLAILTGQDTLFRTTWTNSGGAVTSLVGLWGINRMEETGQLGYQITECRSIYDQQTGAILKPSSGTKLFMYLNAGTVVLECLIDGSVAQSGLNYNLSSRIANANATVEGKLMSPTNEIKDTSGTVETKVEAP